MKKLLLHSCCGPCSTAVIERLLNELNDYEILVYYYNPNIYPEEEYVKRKEEQKKYINIFVFGMCFIYYITGTTTFQVT